MEEQEGFFSFLKEHKQAASAFGVAAVGVLTFVTRYHVAKPHQYLAITGPTLRTGIEHDMKLAKAAFRWPLQIVTPLDMTPIHFSLHLDTMSSDKQDIGLPLNFTIGPASDLASLRKFALRLSNCDGEKQEHIVAKIAESASRSIVAKLGIEQIFSDRDAYYKMVEEHLQHDLSNFGLEVFQSGSSEIEDSRTRKDGTKYFHYLRLIKAAEAEKTANISVAEMHRQGNIAVKENESITRQKQIVLESEAVQVETTSNIEIAKQRAQQEVEEARFRQQATLAKIEAEKAAQLREAELQRELNVKNIAQETEKMRSEKLAKIVVDAEAQERMAQADLFAAQKRAESVRATGEAEAMALLAKGKADAETIRLRYEAEAEGLKRLQDTLGDPSNLLQREMIHKGTYESVAKSAAEGLQGLKPTIWTLEGGTEGGFKTLAPYIKLISDAVGVKIPQQQEGPIASPGGGFFRGKLHSKQ